MYINPVSCVNINGNLTGWFPIEAGVLQGHTLSPTLFSFFINDLAAQINELNMGVSITDSMNLSVLLHADDFVMISPAGEGCQQMLDVVTRLCGKWGIAMNTGKSQVVHVRNHQCPQCQEDL